MATLAPPPTLSWEISSDTHAGAFEAYREGMADLYEIVEIPGSGGRGFANRASITLFENGTIGRGRSAPQTMVRTASQIRRSNLDTISIVLNRSPVVGDCDGVDVRAKPGAVQFRDLGRPSTSTLESVDVLNLMTPRERAPAWMLDGAIHGLVLDAGSPVGRLLSSHLSVLSRVASGLTQEEGTAAIEAAFLIAGRAMDRGGPPTPLQAAAVHRTVRTRATQYIESRLLDPTLTATEIAAATGASRSTLYRAFADQGGIHRRIRNLRLDRARLALRRRIGRYPSISEIAYHHGFVSEAHFSRLFRDRFGCAPGDVGAPQPAATGAPRNASLVRYDAWLDWLRDIRSA